MAPLPTGCQFAKSDDFNSRSWWLRWCRFESVKCEARRRSRPFQCGIRGRECRWCSCTGTPRSGTARTNSTPSCEYSISSSLSGPGQVQDYSSPRRLPGLDARMNIGASIVAWFAGPIFVSPDPLPVGFSAPPPFGPTMIPPPPPPVPAPPPLKQPPRHRAQRRKQGHPPPGRFFVSLYLGGEFPLHGHAFDTGQCSPSHVIFASLVAIGVLPPAAVTHCTKARYRIASVAA